MYIISFYMEKRRIIKLTEKQLREAETDAFTFLKNGDFNQYAGQSEISVSGRENDDEWGEPKTTDDLADKITSQSYNRFSGFAYRPHALKEGDMDGNDDGVDDFYNNEELDTLSDGDENDDLTKIPEGVQNKCDILISAMQNLTPKQQAIVLNKLIESFDFSNLPYSWLKELKMKINTKRKI